MSINIPILTEATSNLVSNEMGDRLVVTGAVNLDIWIV